MVMPMVLGMETPLPPYVLEVSDLWPTNVLTWW